MAEQFNNAPAPSRKEFDDLAAHLGTIDTFLETASSSKYISNLQSGSSVTCKVGHCGFIICDRVHSNTSLNVFSVFAIGDNQIQLIADVGASKGVISVSFNTSTRIATIQNNHSVAVNVTCIS